MSILVTSKSKAPTTARPRGRRASNRRCDFCFRQKNKLSPPHRRNRRRVRRQRFRRRHRCRRTWFGWRWIFRHWCQSRVMSSEVETSLTTILISARKQTIKRFLDSARNDKLLQQFAVNLINAYIAAYEIPIFLIGETASVRGPGKLARRFWMVRIVNQIALNPRIRRKRLSLINQDGVIDAETWESSKKTNKELPPRQSRIQTSVRRLLIPRTHLKNHPGITDSEVAGPAMADIQLHNFPTRLAHFPQVLVAR